MSIRIVLAASTIAVLGISAPLAYADDASKEQVISEIVEIMQYDKIGDQLGDLTASQMLTQLKAKNPDIDAETESALRKIARDYMSELMSEMNPLLSELMSKHFTEEELREMLAFHKSDVGRKSIEKTPLIMQETMAWAQQKAMSSGPGLKARIDAALEELKASEALTPTDEIAPAGREPESD